MDVKSILPVFICYLTVISNVNSDSMFITVITMANVSIGWNDFPLVTCDEPTSVSVSLLTSTTPSNNMTTDVSTYSPETTLSIQTTNQMSTSNSDVTTSDSVITTFALVVTTAHGLSMSSSDTTLWTTGEEISLPTTVQQSLIVSVITYTCVDGSLGQYCNISSNVCEMSAPCLNGASCYANNTLSLGYTCGCPVGYSGYNCEFNNNVCKDDTCWRNGTCIEVNMTVSSNNVTTFQCQCSTGYYGSHCELEDNLCANITCQNMGVCMSSHLSWTCQCLDSSLYSGVYCEDKSAALQTKQAVSRSLAVVAIVALGMVCGFVVIMDIMKYVFKIDPIDREFQRLKMEKEKEKQKRQPIKKKKQVMKKIKKRKLSNSLRFSVV